MDKQEKLNAIHEYADADKSKNIDSQEWNKISTLFAQEAQSDVADKNAENLKDLRNHLDSPFVVGRLLGMLNGQINSIKTQEDLAIYESCLNAMVTKIQSKAGAENTDADTTFGNSFRSLDSQIGTIKVKLANTKKQLSLPVLAENKDNKNTVTKEKQNELTSPAVSSPEVAKPKESTPDTKESVGSGGGVTKLQQHLDALNKTEIINFKGVIDDLSKGLVTPENIKPFASMVTTLRQMKGIPKEQIMPILESTINKHFLDKKSTTETSLFKKTLSAVLDNNNIDNLLNKIDGDLDGNTQLQGLPYASLLDSKTNLKSPEAQAGINTLFHRDESKFDAMVVDFNNPEKKTQISNIVKEYIKSSLPFLNLEKATIQVGTIFVTDALGKKSEKSCFNVMDGNKVMEYAGANDINQKLTPFFGDQQGATIPMEQCLTMPLMKGVLGKGALKMPGVAAVMSKLITVDGKPRSLTDSITSLFNNPLFDQLKQALYTLMSFLGGDESQKKAQIELSILSLKDTMKGWGKMADVEGKEGMSYIDAFKKIELQIDQEHKELFLGANKETQQKYLAMAVTSGTTLAGKLLKGDKPKPQSKTTNVDTAASQGDKPKAAVEFASGGEYAELSLDGNTPGKVEKKGSGDAQYLTVDGQVVSLDKNGAGSMFVKKENGIIEKKISLTTDATTKNETILVTEANALDSKPESIKKVFDNKKLIYPEQGVIPANQLSLMKYYAVEQGVDGNNPIDNLMNSLNTLSPRNDKIDQAIATMKRSLATDTTKPKDSIQQILKTGKDAIANQIASTPKDKQELLNNALRSWSDAVGAEAVKTEAKKPASTTTQLKKQSSGS